MWCKSLEVLNPYEALKEANMTDLKPCPVCGASEYDIAVYCEGMAKQYLELDGRISPIYFSDCDGWCVACKECGYETYHFAKPELAIEAWNQRAGEEDKHEQTD